MYSRSSNCCHTSMGGQRGCLCRNMFTIPLSTLHCLLWALGTSRQSCSDTCTLPCSLLQVCLTLTHPVICNDSYMYIPLNIDLYTVPMCICIHTCNYMYMYKYICTCTCTCIQVRKMYYMYIVYVLVHAVEKDIAGSSSGDVEGKCFTSV